MVFVLTSKNPENDAMIKARIVQNFPQEWYEIGRGQWLVSFSGTSRELYGRLFPKDLEGFPVTGGVFIGGLNGYYGWSAMDVWEWIRAKTGS